MNTSLFLEIVEKFFKAVVGKITEKFNGSKKEPTLLHKTMLTEEYSADLTWGATELQHSVVAADVVALDSPLPLKSRGSFSNATGKLPKLGVKFRKGEKDISDINVMRARGVDEATIAAKIFDDAPKVVKSMDVRKEIMFQQGLSTGQTLVEDDENNTGTGIRVTFGYKAENIFHAIKAAWGEEGYDPIEDIRQMFDKAEADSNTITIVLISRSYLNLIRSSMSGKQLVADFQGRVYVSTDFLPQPSRKAILEALADEFGAEFRIVEGSFRIEHRDGSFETVKPWAEANIVGIPSENVGRLVYGTLAEETNPVAGVTYEKSGSHVLLSKYSKTDPLEEFTAGQAICLTVIDGADSIYLLHADGTKVLSVDKPVVEMGNEANSTGIKVKVHAENAYTVSQTASTSWLTPTKSADGKTITLTVTANGTGSARTSTVTLTDSEGNTATIVVNQAAAIDVTPSSLTFPKSGSSGKGKKITVKSDSDFEVAADVSWLSFNREGNDVFVSCEANDATSAPQRTATITVTNADSETDTVSVTQAANT